MLDYFKSLFDSAKAKLKGYYEELKGVVTHPAFWIFTVSAVLALVAVSYFLL